MNRSQTAAAPEPERQVRYAWIVAGHQIGAALPALGIEARTPRRHGQIAAATP